MYRADNEGLRLDAPGSQLLDNLDIRFDVTRDNVEDLRGCNTELVFQEHGGDQVFHPSEAALVHHQRRAVAIQANVDLLRDHIDVGITTWAKAASQPSKTVPCFGVQWKPSP